MNKNYTADIFLVVAVSVLVASQIVWLGTPPNLVNAEWMQVIYSVWLPFAIIAVGFPIAFFLGRNQRSAGFLSPLVRWILLLVILVAAIFRVYKKPNFPGQVTLDKNNLIAANEVVRTNDLAKILPTVTPPPANFSGTVPTPFPSVLDGLKSGDSITNSQLQTQIQQQANTYHDAAQSNKGNNAAENYIAQAAAAAAAIYVMSEIPPPANALVAKAVGQLLMSLFGDGSEDPGDALAIGQLIVAAVSGDPSQIDDVINNSGIDLNALSQIADGLSKNKDILNSLQQAGIQPDKIVNTINNELTKQNIPDLNAALNQLNQVFQGQPDEQQIIDLITKQLPANSVNGIVSKVHDDVGFAHNILNAVHNDPRIATSADANDLLKNIANRWANDAAITNSDVPIIYKQITGNNLTTNN